MNISTKRRFTVAATAVTSILLLAACGTTTSSDHPSMDDMPNMNMSTPRSAPMGDMTGMPMFHGTGLAASVDGYTLTLDGRPATTSRGTTVEFRITQPDGKLLTNYQSDQTKQLHFYAIRTDLTGFQHVHPILAADGTWTAALETLARGSWRLYTAFIPDAGPQAGQDLVLSTKVTIPGMVRTEPVPAVATSTTVDGYTATFDGTPTVGDNGTLTVAITRDGKGVTDLQPYLDTYAHMTGIRSGDLAFTHLHPADKVIGDRGGPSLTFRTEFPEAGTWRLFLQFRTNGTLHTAAISIRVN